MRHTRQMTASAPHKKWKAYSLTLYGLLAFVCPFPAPAAQDLAALREFLEAREIPASDTALAGAMEDAFIHAIDARATFLASPPTNATPALEDVALSEILPGNIFFCRLNGLNGQAAAGLSAAMAPATNPAPAGIVLDLRHTGGSQLDDVDAVASLFLDDDLALYHIRNGAGKVLETHRTQPASTASPMPRPPLILLSNKETHGAGEILAACLAGRSGIMLIGTPTDGDSGLRDTLSLPDGRFLHIATRWVVPFERPSYQEKGVIPDLEVSDDYPQGQPWLPAKAELARNRPLSEKAKLQHDLMQRVADDAVLSRAADILLGLGALEYDTHAPVATKATLNAIED